MKAITVDGLRMRYGAGDVLNDVTFQVDSGKVLALLGPNGAGKTTTIEILEGFRRRSAGRVSVLGVDPAHGDERWRARIGIVLQSWRDHAKSGGPPRLPRADPGHHRRDDDHAHHPRPARSGETRRPHPDPERGPDRRRRHRRGTRGRGRRALDHLDGQRHERSTQDSTWFVFDLFKQYGDAVSGLEVRPASLEDTYLTLVENA